MLYLTMLLEDTFLSLRDQFQGGESGAARWAWTVTDRSVFKPLLSPQFVQSGGGGDVSLTEISQSHSNCP